MKEETFINRHIDKSDTGHYLPCTLVDNLCTKNEHGEIVCSSNYSKKISKDSCYYSKCKELCDQYPDRCDKINCEDILKWNLDSNKLIDYYKYCNDNNIDKNEIFSQENLDQNIRNSKTNIIIYIVISLLIFIILILLYFNNN